MNILTSENIKRHNTKNVTAGVGEYVLRNGVWAMDIRPAPFYLNYTDTDGSTKLSYCLREEFYSGQWVFSLWIDADLVIHNNKNVAAGMYVVYTDGTYVNLVVTGGENIGFQHKYYISDANKTVDRVSNYYHVSLPTYYRYDSFIVPVEQTSFNKTGIIDSGFYIEGLTSLNGDNLSGGGGLGMSLGKFGVNAEEFIEY